MADTTTGETLADTTVTTSTRADTAIGINNLKFVLMTIKIMSRLSFVASVGKFTLCTEQFSLFSTVLRNVSSRVAELVLVISCRSRLFILMDPDHRSFR